MDNYKEFRKMSEDEYDNKFKQLQVSYFMQCIDLTNAFNGNEMDEERRKCTREIVEGFVDDCPNTTFIDLTKFIGFLMMKEGVYTEKEYIEKFLRGWR